MGKLTFYNAKASWKWSWQKFNDDSVVAFSKILTFERNKHFFIRLHIALKRNPKFCDHYQKRHNTMESL